MLEHAQVYNFAALYFVYNYKIHCKILYENHFIWTLTVRGMCLKAFLIKFQITNTRWPATSNWIQIDIYDNRWWNRCQKHRLIWFLNLFWAKPRRIMTKFLFEAGFFSHFVPIKNNNKWFVKLVTTFLRNFVETAVCHKDICMFGAVNL